MPGEPPEGARPAVQRLKSAAVSAWHRRAVRWSAITLVVLVGVGSSGLFGLNLWVRQSAEQYRYADVSRVPERPVAIVLGAGVVGSDPTPALASRLDGAIDLYRAGKVSHLLMSGDNSRPDYDEVSVMRDYAIARGIPSAVITRDYAGFDTYDTCARARDVFGVSAATVVTQDFHIARAIFTCRRLGIDTVGLAVPDWAFRAGDLDYRYSRDQQIGYTVREWLARAKAVVETEIVHPSPRFDGPYVGLTET